MKYKLEDNPFNNIFFDITYRCDMRCRICYNEKRMDYNNARNKPDMSLEYIKEVFKRIRKREKPYTIRIVGGEPMLHPQLNEMIQVMNQYGNNVTIATNGKRLATDSFIKEVETWKDPELASKNKIYRCGDYPFIPFFDFSGGFENDLLYEKIHQQKLLEMRLRAFNNCVDIGMNTIGICAIIIRGINEEVVPQLIEFAEQHKEIPAIHFRTMTRSGAFLRNEPYTLQELKKIVEKYVPGLNDKPNIRGFIPPEGKKCYDCCYRFVMNPGLGINLVEFGSARSTKCWLRGFVSDDDFTIEAMFERIRKEY